MLVDLCNSHFILTLCLSRNYVALLQETCQRCLTITKFERGREKERDWKALTLDILSIWEQWQDQDYTQRFFAQLQVARLLSIVVGRSLRRNCAWQLTQVVKLEVAQRNSVCNPGVVQLFPHWGLSTVRGWNNHSPFDNVESGWIFHIKSNCFDLIKWPKYSSMLCVNEAVQQSFESVAWTSVTGAQAELGGLFPRSGHRVFITE